jgi:mannose-6-phosphate isomerase-like protein (cupin superfamily)
MQPKISVPAVLSSITQGYSQKLIANLDGAYDLKVAKIDGPFIWHSHPDADELFYVLNGSMTIQIEDDTQDIKDVTLGKGDVFVVPRGVRHRPMGDAEIMIVEKVGVVNTGDEKESSLTKVPEDTRVQ